VKREYDLQRRLRSLRTLHEAVGAMKSLSAHHFRETRKAVEPARNYRSGVEKILGWTGASLSAGRGAAGLLVVGGELGLCGGYNAHVVELATDRHRVSVMRAYGAPASVSGITDLLLKLAEDILTLYVAEDLSTFEIVSSRFGGVGTDLPTSIQLLPLSSTGSGDAPPVRYVGRDTLASAAIREFLYITLYDVLLDALTAEHSARLVATQSAEQWLEERTERARHHLAATRRESSTQEILEIAAGARARNPTRAP